MFNLCAMVGCCSHVWLFGTTWTVAHQASLSMGFSKQGYWSGLLCLPPGDHPNPRITPSSLSLLNWQEDSLPLSVPGKPYLTYQFSSVQSLSRVRLCDPMNCSTPGLPVHHWLPESIQTHVLRVGDVIQPCHPLCHTLLLPSICPSIRVFSNESTLRMRWPKY